MVARRVDTRILLSFLLGCVVTAAVPVVANWWRAQAVASPGSIAKAPAGPQLQRPLAQSIVQDLRHGGYLLYFRHAQRQQWNSVIAFDVHELATGQDASQAGYRDAVCLTPQGREEARMIGTMLSLGRVPVGTVLSSPVCRARQTAQLAFGRIDGTQMGLVHTPVVNPANAGAFKDALRRVLQEAPIRAGSNTVIAAHENTIRNHPDLFASGTHWFGGGMVAETGFYVIRRDEAKRLHAVFRFDNLGDFASAAVTLPAEQARAEVKTP